MVRAHTLPDRTRAVLAAQLGTRITTTGLEAVTAGSALTLAEDFPMWMLGFDDVMRGNGDVPQLAHRTGYWYHQVRHGDAAREFATSAPFGPKPEDWKIHAIFTSDIAPKVDAAIAWLDQHALADAPVDMLVVPAYALHAFWWTEDVTKVLIIDMPPSFTHLAYEQIYRGADFFALLRQEQRVIAIPQVPPA